MYYIFLLINLYCRHTLRLNNPCNILALIDIVEDKINWEMILICLHLVKQVSTIELINQLNQSCKNKYSYDLFSYISYFIKMKSQQKKIDRNRSNRMKSQITYETQEEMSVFSTSDIFERRISLNLRRTVFDL